MADEEHDSHQEPPPVTTSSLEDELRAAIDAVAPPRYGNKRQQLYDDLADNLDPDTRRRVLLAIVEAHHGLSGTVGAGELRNLGRRAHGRRRTAVRPRGSRQRVDAAEYRRALDSLQAQLWNIDSHPLVRSFPLDEVQFYSLDEAICPHGLWTSRCREIHGMLIRLQAGSQEATLLRRILTTWRINPSVQTPDQFCAPPWMQTDAKPARPRRGARRDHRRHHLVNTIVPMLTATGCRITESLRLVASICRYCFDDPVTLGALRAQRLRLRRKQ